MPTQEEARKAVAQRAVSGDGADSKAVAKRTPEQTVAALFKQLKPQLEQVLPKHVTADRLLRVALFSIRQNPKLLACDAMSLVGAVTQAAQLGLEPGILGHCYLVPFRNARANRTDVQFILGYKGMIELARRSGTVQTIDAHEVYQADGFEFEYGLDPKLVHKPALEKRGAVTAYYAVVKFKDGGYVFAVMSDADIEEVRRRSKAGDEGPWRTDRVAMALKTVIRRLFRFLPVSVELAQSLAADETVKREIGADMVDMPGEIINGEVVETPGPAPDNGPEWTGEQVEEVADPDSFGDKEQAAGGAEVARPEPNPFDDGEIDELGGALPGMGG